MTKNKSAPGAQLDRIVRPYHGQTVKINLVGGGRYPAVYDAEQFGGIFIQNGTRIYPKSVESWDKA